MIGQPGPTAKSTFRYSSSGVSNASENDVEHVCSIASNEITALLLYIPQDGDEDYSAWSRNRKRLLVFAASLAYFLAPMSGAIYMPALVTLERVENVSVTLINIAVTTYLIFQGIAPTFVGGFSDSAGRRPDFLICFVLHMFANVGLTLQSDYVSLILLRCIQSAGGSGTVALASALAADVVASAERGAYVGYASVTTVLAPALAPVLGGPLSQYAGWRWIFIFSFLLALTVLIPFALFFPETCRQVVGNGSTLPPRFNQNILAYLLEKRLRQAGDTYASWAREQMMKQRRVRFSNPPTALVIIFNKQAGLIVICNAFLFACFYATSTSQIHMRFAFDDVKIGSMYPPMTVGSGIFAFTTGLLIDAN